MAKKSSSAIGIPNVVIGALADAFGRDPSTIKTWIKNGDDRLTSDKAKEVFAKWNIEWGSKKELETVSVG